MAESHREEIAKLESLYAGNPGGRVFVHLAEAYRKAGEHERARRILDEGLARHSDSASGYVVLGRVLADMQITGEAEIAFRRVLELDGGNLVALRWLGDLARQAGRNAEAALHYRELLIRNPSNEEVRDLVEIVEREAADDTAAGLTRPADEPTDAFAGLSLDTGEDEEAGVAGPISEAEEPAVTPGAAPANAPEPDITPIAAAPGQTGDVEEPPVEFGLVELDASAADDETGRTREEQAVTPDEEPAAVFELEQAPAQAANADEPSGAQFEFPREAPDEGAAPDRTAARLGTFSAAEDESDMVAAFEDDDSDVLELDELRRDDEVEPIEIHLLDPSYEASAGEEDDEYAGELDLTDLAAADPVEEAGNYADDSFVADLSAADQEEPEEDELPGDVDVLDDALTLLPDAEMAAESAPAAEPATGFAANVPPGEPGGIAPAEPAFQPFALPAEDAGAQRQPPEPESADVEPAHAAGELTTARLTELSGAVQPAAEAASEAPAAEAAPAAEVRRGETGLITETMAVLYRSQGFHDRAADVYRALLRARPDDQRLAAKLREAEAAAAPGGAAPLEADDEAGEVWLRGVGAAWTSPAEDATEEATPYAWTGEADDAEGGEPISTYLQDLVSWKAGSGAWMQPDSAVVDDAAGEIEMPEWLDGPAHEAWTPDSEPPRQPPVPAAEAEWSPPSTEPEPWNPAAGGLADTDPANEATHAGAWPVPEPPSAPSPERPDEETGGGWTPMELEDEIAPPAPPASPFPAGLQPTAQPDEDSSDDDDLEMFRSWLQSLKK